MKFNQLDIELIRSNELLRALSKISHLTDQKSIIPTFIEELKELFHEYDFSWKKTACDSSIEVKTRKNHFGYLYIGAKEHSVIHEHKGLFKNCLDLLAIKLENQLQSRQVFQKRSLKSYNWYSLQREVDLFTSFFETIPAKMYLKDRESCFIKVNWAVKRQFNLSAEEDITGKTDFDFFELAHAQTTFEHEQEIIRTGIPKIGYEEREIQPNGKVTWALSTKMPVYDNEGEIVGIAGISQDITKLKEVEKELNKSNKKLQVALEEVRKGKELSIAIEKLEEAQVQLVQAEKMASVGMLVAGIAHEMNSPLNYISGAKDAIFSYIRSNKEEHFKEIQEFLDLIDLGVTRASAIVKGLNRFNRRNDSYEESCDIHQVIENCLIMLRGEIDVKIEIQKKFTNQPMNLLGNEGELHQVILNIVNNAIQAISDEGLISIITEVQDQKLFVKVVDTGSGIKKENLKKITKPFFTTKEPGKGTGLGTTISASIIEKHKGDITYASEEGKGTTVTVSLPLMSS